MIKTFHRCAAAASLLLPALATASPTAMRLLESHPATDLINVGANTISAPQASGGGAGTLNLVGLSGAVTNAWLYWKGIEIVYPPAGFSTPGNGTYDEPEIHFDNQRITGNLVASNGAVDCHPSNSTNVPSSGALYRADVTAFVQARGNGPYVFSGLSNGLDADPGDGVAHSANGLSLVVYFDDGNSANDRRVDHYEGQLSNTEGPWNFTFPLDYVGGAVELVLHVSDGQAEIPGDGYTRFFTLPGRTPGTPEQLSYNGNLFADGLAKYAGLSVPSMGFGRVPGLWDIRRVPITTQFGRAAHYSTEIVQQFQNDCVSLQIAQVVSAPSAEALMLAPTSHDFGDVPLQGESAAQTFTVTNLWPSAIEFPTGPAWTSTPWYRVVSQTCTGQPLAPGASCSIALACAPPLGNGVPSAAPVSTLSPVWRQIAPNTSINGTLYSKLNCAGVPNGPFSRLEFLPRGCLLNDTLVNTVVTPASIAVRNTGSLPTTLASVVIQNTQGAGFSLLSSTCTAGSVLAPNDSCELRTRFQATSVPSTSRANVYVNFSASDSASMRFATMQLDARSVAALPDDGETLFKDGFQSGVAQCLE